MGVVSLHVASVGWVWYQFMSVWYHCLSVWYHCLSLPSYHLWVWYHCMLLLYDEWMLASHGMSRIHVTHASHEGCFIIVLLLLLRDVHMYIHLRKCMCMRRCICVRNQHDRCFCKDMCMCKCRCVCVRACMKTNRKVEL